MFETLISCLACSLLIALVIIAKYRSELVSSKTRLDAIACATHDSLWDWNLKTNYVWRSGNLNAIYGSSDAAIGDRVSWWRDRMHPDDVDRVWNSLTAALSLGENHWISEYRIRRHDGSYAVILDRAVVVRDNRGRSLRMVGAMADVTARKRAEERLVHTASHDSLTGLPNRFLFLDRLRHSLNSRRSASLQDFAVLFIDLDHFKNFNDDLGHTAGDEILRIIASRIASMLEPTDTAARFGGDEFTVLLAQPTSAAAAVQTAELIQREIARPIEIGGHRIFATASIGVAFDREADADQLIHMADTAMYRAKARSKGHCEMSDGAQRSDLVSA